MAQTPPEKIVIRTPNWLGDLMMSTVFIHAVLQGYPDAQVDLIVKAGFEQIPLARRGTLYPFDKSQQSAKQFGSFLKAQAYDRFYVLPPSFSSAWMAFWSRAKERVGHGGNGRDGLLQPALARTQPPRTRHLIEEYLELLDPALRPETLLPRLDISDAWVAQQLSTLPQPLPPSFVVVAPGAIYGPAKQWPSRHYRRLLELIAQTNWVVLLMGTEADFAEGERLSAGLEHVYNRCGTTSLVELIAVLAKAALLISNDSGSMHLMAALQRPQIAIFGSTSPTWTAPLNPHAQILHHPLRCSPCFQRTCRYGHYDCLESIAPADVFEKVKGWLLDKA